MPESTIREPQPDNTNIEQIHLQALAKVELHLHMDIFLSFEAAVRLDPALTPDRYQRELVAPEKCDDLADFLSRVPKILSLLQTEAALRLLVEDIFRQLAEDGVIYAELRFAPLLHTQHGLTPSQVVRVVNAALEQSIRDSGIETRLILCSLRHFSADQSLQTVELVEAFRGSHVAGFDLAGDEAGFLSPHTWKLSSMRVIE